MLIGKEKSIRTVTQIDIVPTLAKLLGIAIPYSNLGIYSLMFSILHLVNCLIVKHR